MICDHCGKDFPDKFIHPFRTLKTNERAVEMKVDPICALKLKGEVHGRTFRKFQGDSAQQLLVDFRKWKRASASKKKRAATKVTATKAKAKAKAKAKTKTAKVAKATKAKKTTKQTKKRTRTAATATA